MKIEQNTVLALIIAGGLTLCGAAIGSGFVSARAADRFVTVKGVAAREVQADLAIWPIRISGADNNLATANEKVATSVAGVRRFLAKHGIDTLQVQLSGFSVNDANSNQYASERRPENRFIVNQTMLVRSSDPAKVLAASQQVGELAAIGVAISSGNGEYGPGSGGPSFVFTKLNELKPAMIADATARAREGAEQFARDSRSKLGNIRQANQGMFEILPRDQAPGLTEESQISKIVRVVSTIEYFLK
jgi:uncharacterized protein